MGFLAIYLFLPFAVAHFLENRILFGSFSFFAPAGGLTRSQLEHLPSDQLRTVVKDGWPLAVLAWRDVDGFRSSPVYHSVGHEHFEEDLIESASKEC